MTHLHDIMKSEKERFEKEFGNLILGILSNPEDNKSPVFVNQELEVPRLKNWLTSHDRILIEGVIKMVEERKEGSEGYSYDNGYMDAVDDIIRSLRSTLTEKE